MFEWNAARGLEKWYRGIPRPTKAAFFSGIIVGLFAHVTIITNPLFHYDDYLIEGLDWIITQGKWFAATASRLDAGNYNSSLAILTAILALALAAALLVDTLQIRHTLWGGCVGAVMVTFPSVMCSLTFYFNMWGVCFTMLAVWLVYRYPGWKSWLTGTIILVFCLGVYQPYIGVPAAALLMCCVREILREESTVKQIMAKAVSYFFLLLCGMLGYYGVLQIELKRNSVELGSYKGIDQVASVDWKNMPALIVEAYKYVLRMFLRDEYGNAEPHIVWTYRFLFLLLTGTALLVAWKKGLFRKPAKLALYALFMGLIPLAVNLVYPLSHGTPTSWVSMYPWALLFALPFVLADIVGSFTPETKTGGGTWKTLLVAVQQWSSVALACLMCWIWVVLSHEGYLRLEMAFYGAYGELVGVVDDIYGCPGYTRDTEVALIDEEKETVQDMFPQFNNYPGMTTRDFIYVFGGRSIQRFINILLQPDLRYADNETIERIQQTEEYERMPNYPDEGYMQWIDGVIVAKF